VTGHSKYINGPAGLAHLHRLRALVDLVLIGIGTAVADDPLLTVRRCTGPSPARAVLDPRGRLCVCVQHPVWDAGKFVGTGPDAAFVLGPTYFGPRRMRNTFERNGLSVTFEGWCFSLDDYARAFERAGFLIESLREPLPGPSAPPTTRGRRLPIFLMLRLFKRD